MKMNKSILQKLAVFALLLPLYMGGCDLFEDQTNEHTYDGDKQVEFDPYIASVEERGAVGDDPVRVSPFVNLISPEGVAQSDLGINFVVDDSSTAVAGDHYDIVSSSPLTIPSGEAFTTMEIDITADDLNDDESVILYVTLQGNGDDVRGAENYKTLTLTIEGVTD